MLHWMIETRPNNSLPGTPWEIRIEGYATTGEDLHEGITYSGTHYPTCLPTIAMEWAEHALADYPLDFRYMGTFHFRAYKN